MKAVDVMFSGSKSKAMPDIMIAPTGARRMRSDHANLPVTIPQIVDETLKCIKAGADRLHLHVRNKNGNHSLEPVLYRQALDALQQHAPDFPVQITTESAGLYAPHQQLSVLLDLQPESASVSVREIAQDEAIASRLYKSCLDLEIDVQHILYDTKDLDRLCQWIEAGIVGSEQNDVIFVVGQYLPSRMASVEELNRFLSNKPDEFTSWTVCAFGKTEQEVLVHAAKAGGNVRIGFENNIHRPDGTLATSNAENVEAFVRSLRQEESAKGGRS